MSPGVDAWWPRSLSECERRVDQIAFLGCPRTGSSTPLARSRRRSHRIEQAAQDAGDALAIHVPRVRDHDHRLRWDHEQELATEAESGPDLEPFPVDAP